MKSTIIIPAFQPERQLRTIVGTLRKRAPETPLIVVDDGSGRNYTELFDSIRAAGAIILNHPENRGKGAALKTAFRFWLQDLAYHQHGVITADADGQHHPDDILKLLTAQNEEPLALHLGTRQFSTGATPWRSRLGNYLSALLFQLFTHQKLADTQTGLRGVSRDLVQAMTGSTKNGYEFEMEMIVTACRQGCPLQQHPVQAIYLAGNPTSHFRPVVDSCRVYLILLKLFFER